MGRSAFDLLIFIGKRIVWLPVVLLGVSLITFYFSHFAVANPCAVWEPKAHGSALQACISANNLNKPVFVQFGDYTWGLLSGNWGSGPPGTAESGPVWPALLQAFPETLELVLAALFLMIFIGIPLGVVAAQYSGRFADHLIRVFYLSGWATPTYLGAVIAALWLAPVLGLPSGGLYTVNPPPFHQVTHVSILDAVLAGNPTFVADGIAHLILPASVLAFINLGIATRMTRSSMLEVLPLDYVKSARMKGLTEFWVLYKHALRNALITTTTVLGVTAGGLLSSTVVVEEIFSWPGIGSYAYNAITNYNFDGTIGVVLFFATGVVIANLIADILYGVLDPKVDWR